MSNIRLTLYYYSDFLFDTWLFNVIYVIYILTSLKHPDNYINISYMSYEILHGKEQFRSKKYLLEMNPLHAEMRLKNAPEKLNFVMAKAT